jgi:hypothetical protein
MPLLALTGFLVVMLSGCMEALQSGQGAGNLPPAALPSPTSTAAVASEVATSAEPPSAVATVPTPTVTAVAPVVPTPLDTATAIIVQASPSPEATLVLPTPQPLTNEQRWRAQQINRTVLDPQRSYTTSSSELWWYDPINQQHVILGAFTGGFLAQAQFTLRGQGIEALEVPYQVNVSYGLTALSPALVARIHAAGGKDWIETYVFVTPNVTPR